MQTRRDVLFHSVKVAALLASVGMLPTLAHAQAGAYNSAAFEAKNLAGPDIAENGAVVPVGASTSLAGVKRLLILVEKNPSVMAAMFELTDAIESSVSTRVKMGQSSNVYAVAMMNDGRLLFAQKEVKVTLGGCGG